MINRRGFLRTGLIGASGVGLAGCKVLDGANAKESALRDVFESVSGTTYRAQRFLQGGGALAPEYSAGDIRQGQRSNGSVNPDGDEYLGMASAGFSNYSLTISGLVDRPLTIPLRDLQAMPARTQITRHDCVEGWSCIAKWTGVPLGAVLDLAGPKLNARYAVFQCYDAIERGLSGVVTYYESIDLIDAYHPQTILAYGMNDKPLPVANGAPLRVRVERQLGYKMAKYIRSIELVDSLAMLGQGRGSYWADRGYEWYAGI